MLSRDRTAKELSWSRCAYAEPQIIKPPLALPAAAAAGGGLCQPAESLGRYPWAVCRAFWLACFWQRCQAYFVYRWRAALLRQQLAFQPSAGRGDRGQQPVRGAGQYAQTGADQRNRPRNNWIGLSVNLVNELAAKPGLLSRRCPTTEGVDDGESWSEGSRSDEMVFPEFRRREPLPAPIPISPI